jgi:hypothetical protein
MSRRPDIDQVERLAKVLGLGVEDICTIIPEEERILTKGGQAALLTGPGSKAIFSTFVDHWLKFASYASHISFRLQPPRGFVQNFLHDGRLQHSYATVRIKPAQPIERADFVFSFGMGLVRVEFGAIEVRQGALAVRPYFAAYDEEGVLSDDGSFGVRVWLGAESCPFVVRCAEVDFRADLLFPGCADRRHKVHDKDVVTFAAAPHHLLAVGSSGRP